MNPLAAIHSIKRSGDEYFHIDGNQIDSNLLSFWRWSSSELLGNALRGVLAEYLVATDLGCNSGVRQEWDAYDILTDDGVRIEVKSAAYLQSWNQKRLSSIQFGIAPTFGWNARTNETATEKSRQSDAYVFCVLAHKDMATVDPMNLTQWDFYILATRILNLSVETQATMTLSRLLQLGPHKCKYGELSQGVRRALATKSEQDAAVKSKR